MAAGRAALPSVCARSARLWIGAPSHMYSSMAAASRSSQVTPSRAMPGKDPCLLLRVAAWMVNANDQAVRRTQQIHGLRKPPVAQGIAQLLGLSDDLGDICLPGSRLVEDVGGVEIAGMKYLNPQAFFTSPQRPQGWIIWLISPSFNRAHAASIQTPSSGLNDQRAPGGAL